MKTKFSNIKKLSKIFIFGLFLFSAQTAFAVTFSFENITNNNTTDAAIGEAQLFVDVTNILSSKVLFHLYNTGPLASSITDVYFDDDPGLLSSLFSIGGSSGVAFSQGASPPNLPGGNNTFPAFSANSAFDSDPPAQPNGVNPGEYLDITFNALFSDVLAAINNSNLRIGIHVQGFAGGGSESFINNGPKPVPEPATLLLLGSGLLGLVGYSRRKFKKN